MPNRSDKFANATIPPLVIGGPVHDPKWGMYTTTQLVIPRYADKGAQASKWSTRRSIAPAGQVIGNGPESVISGTKETQNLPTLPIDQRCIIKTEDWENETALFGCGEHDREVKPAILRPVLRDFTCVGHDDTGYPPWTDHGKVGDEPGIQNPAIAFNAGWPDLYGGAFIKGTGAVVAGVTFFYIPGTALWIARTGGNRAGRFGPWDIEKTTIRDVEFVRCYRGLNLQVIDARIGSISGNGLRDYGIKFSGGGNHIDGSLHFWGVSPGPCLWFSSSSGQSWGGPIYVENSAIGMLVESSRNMLGPVYFHANTLIGINIVNERNTIQLAEGTVSHQNAVGIRINSQNNTITGGLIQLGNASAVGVELLPGGGGASGKRFRSLNVDYLGINSTTGTAIVAHEPLNGCTIIGHFQNLKHALELKAGLGTGNYIRITSEGVEREVWNNGLWNADRNEIWINGVRL